KCGNGTATIDLRLSSLGFELIENPGQRGNLSFIKVELMGQKPKRAANAKTAAATAAFETFFGPFPGGTARPAARPTAKTATTCEKSALGAPSGHESWMHDFLLLAGAVRTPAGTLGVGYAPHALFYILARAPRLD